MENLFFLKIEIVIFIISFFYAIFYILMNIRYFFIRLSRWKRANRIMAKTEKEKEKINETTHNEELLNEKENAEEKKDLKEEKKDRIIQSENKIKITDILRKEAILYEQWNYTKAKSLIIEGLSLDKNHKQLNLELANIYNKLEEFKKSEFIYRDLIEKQNDDFELLKKLGFILALQKKYKDSIRVYKEALEQKENDLSIVDILSDLTFEVKDYESAKKYTKIMLKDKPRNVEKLQILAYSYDSLGKTKKAINAYDKILEMQPYNKEILQRVKKLEEHIIEKIKC